jgi:CheY-like chemotaxis protein
LGTLDHCSINNSLLTWIARLDILSAPREWRMDIPPRGRFAHGGAWLIPRSSVLIVDRSDESREVLKTALERRGWQIFESARAADGLALARQHRPALIVLDLDAVGAKAAQSALAADAEIQEIPLVLLGTIRRTGRYAAANSLNSPANSRANRSITSSVAKQNSPTRSTGSFGQIVAKPYHYGSLILKIEQMLRQGQHQAGHV